MTAPMVEQFRQTFREELIKAIQNDPWDDDTMYEVAQCILGKIHPLTEGLKKLMEAEYGPID